MGKERGNARDFLLEVTNCLNDQPLPLGTVAQAVIRLTADSQISVSRLARAVSSDMGLTGKLIKKANSAFYGGSARATSVPLAIMRLGFGATRSLAIAGSVQAMFRVGDNRGFERSLWAHSLGVGTASRIIMRRAVPSLVEEAYLTGLLHDIAKLVLLQRFPLVYEPILKDAERSGRAIVHIELDRLGFTHADLGAVILDHWNFAEAEVRAVRFHHHPEQSGQTADKPSIARDAAFLAHSIGLADSIIKGLEAGDSEFSESAFADHPDAKHFEFHSKEYAGFYEELRDELGDELQVFGEGVGSVF